MYNVAQVLVSLFFLCVCVCVCVIRMYVYVHAQEISIYIFIYIHIPIPIQDPYAVMHICVYIHLYNKHIFYAYIYIYIYIYRRVCVFVRRFVNPTALLSTPIPGIIDIFRRPLNLPVTAFRASEIASVHRSLFYLSVLVQDSGGKKNPAVTKGLTVLPGRQLFPEWE
jgi:hypothetical protein